MELFKITTLMDNLITGEGLVAEHGLSLLIETNNYKILFDAGQSDLFVKNVETLNVKLDEVDFAILSHGHYDHTGGIPRFLEINKKAKIVYKDGLFSKRWNATNEIGVRWDKSLVDNRSVVINKLTEIVPDVFVVTDINIHNEKDTHFKNLFVEKNGVKEMDTFTDELFIVVVKDKMINIITGCAHNGISNIVSTAKDLFPGMKINLVTGGFHLSKETDEVKSFVLNELKELGVTKIKPLHCSGELHWC